MAKVSEFMITIIFVSFCIAVFGILMASMNLNYGVTYDNSSLASYNQLEKMSNLSKELETRSEIQEKTGVLDVIGSYFTDAYNVLKLTKTSFNMFDTMTNEAIQDANLGQAGNLLKIAISAGVLIMLVVGILIAAIVKWPV